MERQLLTLRRIGAAATVVAIALDSSAVTACAEPGAGAPMTVCMYKGFAPFVSATEDVANIRNWTGWDVDFLTKFAATQGRTLVPVPSEFDGIWRLPGQSDPPCLIAASGISDLPQRRADSPGTLWSSHYYCVERAFGVRFDNREALHDVPDFIGKRVIVTKGSTAQTDLVNRLVQAGIPYTLGGNGVSDQGSVDIAFATDESAAAQDVVAGRAFAYGGGLGSIQELIKSEPDLVMAWPHFNLVAPDGVSMPEPFSFVVGAEAPQLAHALNDYIAANAADYGDGSGSCPAWSASS